MLRATAAPASRAVGVLRGVVKLKAAAGAAFGLMILTGGASAGLPKLPSRERFGGGFDILAETGC